MDGSSLSLSPARQWAKHDFKGHVVVMTTPFNDDLTIDEAAIRSNLAKSQALECVNGVYINSIYNEPTAMTTAERMRIVEISMSALEPGITSIVAIGGLSLPDAIEAAQHAEKLGASMLMFWPPTFGHRSREGVQAFFKALMGSVKCPVALYRSGLSEFGYLSSIEEISELADLFPHFCAIKDASMSVAKYLAIIDALGDRIAISCPLDEFWVVGRMLMPNKTPGFLLGSSRPLYCETADRHYLSELRSATERGDRTAIEAALSPVLRISNELHNRYLEAGGHNVALTKRITSLLGYVCGQVRPPLSLPSMEAMAPARQLFESVGFTVEA